MPTSRYVAYYRISTDKQGRSGLGLEAQRQAVASYLGRSDGSLIAELEEVVSGRRRHRVVLTEALALARKEKATLIVAKLDRLSRSTLDLLKLIDDARVSVVFCDFPDMTAGPASRFFMTVLAGAAEFEARLISERTKAALAAAKRRGTILGANGKILAAQNKADALVRMEPVSDRLKALRASGLSIRRMASVLNDEGVPAPGEGGSWHSTTVHRALKRLSV